MDIAHEIQNYVDAVCSGKRVAGELQRLACQRYKDDLKRAKQKNFPFYFDQNRAEIACAFFPDLLVHTSGDWIDQPFVLDIEKAFCVWNLQGWRKKSNGTRRFRSAHIECSRKWGKTTFAAGLCWQFFMLDGEGRPEIYNCATKRKQSLRCFDEIVRMRAAQPAFESRTRLKASEYSIRKSDQGVIEALGCDGGGSDGLFPYVVIFDELHEWKSKAHRDLWAKLRTGSSLRSQPLFLTITTAGDNQSALWIEERSFATKVLRGEASGDHLFAFILCLDDSDDIFDESCWTKANPLVHASGFENVLAEYRTMAAEALWNPVTKKDFERYYCNRRVESVNLAIPAAVWQLGAVALPVLSGRICHGAADLGWRDDIAAFAECFPPRAGTDPYVIRAQGFLPTDCKRDLTEHPFPLLIQSGKLVITPGNTTDTGAIHQHIDSLRELYNLKTVAVDPNNAREFGTQLVTKGLKVYEFQQSCKNYNEPMREFLRLLSDGRIIHGGCPLLSWCQSHLMTFSNPEGLIMPSKKSSAEKIDPLVAVIMAFAEAMFSGIRDPEKGVQIRFL